MIDISKLTYRVYAVLADGRQINITGAVTAFGWSEGENEISARTTATMANATYGREALSSIIVPGSVIVVTADTGSGEKEVIRGSITEWGPSRSSGGNSFSVAAYDELFNFQQSQDDRYITAGTGTKSAITALFGDWGIPVGEYKGPDIPHAKTIFKAQYLSDIVFSLLDDAEKHGADKYVIRAAAGAASVIPIGSNDDIYHFTEAASAITTSDRISTGNLVTRVKVLGLADDDGMQAVEAIVDGKTEYGIRQRLYNRSEDDTLETAKAAAQAMIDTEGEPERSSTVQAPDIPFIRKGDKISLATSSLTGYFIIKSITHDGTNRKMTMVVRPTQGEELVMDAIDRLASLGIINSPAYWKANYKNTKYVDLLLVNAASAAIAAGPRCGTVAEGAARLSAAGVINTPEYWVQQTGNVGELVKALGGAVY